MNRRDLGYFYDCALTFTNMNSTIAENIFKYKYNYTYPYDWFGPLNVILKKIECYVSKCSSTVDIFTATAIRQLCHERDTCNTIIYLMYIHKRRNILIL